MSAPRVGSMCSGYGGLDLAVEAVVGARLTWVAESDQDASKVLAFRFPGVPNLGDITAADWAAAEPVDILTAGFPCQPVSAAGKRKGLDDERWLFDDICSAVGRMVARPRLLVLENVPGLLSANGGDAMARVVQGLAALGYECSWRLVRASDAGAPHKRERWFCTAWPAADPGGARLGQHAGESPAEETRPGAGDLAPSDGRARPDRDRRPAAEDPHLATGGERRVTAPVEAEGGRARADSGGPGGARAAADAERDSRAEDEPDGATAGRDSDAPADAEGDGRGEGRPEPAGIVGGPDASLGGHGAAPDAQGGGRERERGLGVREGRQPEPRRDAPADADGERLRRRAERDGEAQQPEAGHAGRRVDPQRRVLDWGPYTGAIRRWERVLGRPAPRPTEPGKTGERLSPLLVEWMMGLSEGWVTGVPGLSRNAMLKILGNGVVPQQAALPLRVPLCRAFPSEAERGAV